MLSGVGNMVRMGVMWAKGKESVDESVGVRWVFLECRGKMSSESGSSVQIQRRAKIQYLVVDFG